MIDDGVVGWLKVGDLVGYISNKKYNCIFTLLLVVKLWASHCGAKRPIFLRGSRIDLTKESMG